MLHPGAFDDAIVAAFGHADSDDALNRMLVVDAETQLPDDLLHAHRQDDDGNVARVPRSAARPRARRADGAHRRRRQGPWRRVEAHSEARVGRISCRRKS